MNRHLRSALLVLAAAGCSTEPEVEAPQQFVIVRRAWAPGERQATIDQVKTTGALAFASFYASTIFADPDSVSVMMPNPAWTPPDPHLTTPLAFHMNRFTTGWIIAGTRIESYNADQTPPDTVVWTGLFFYDPADTDDRGYVIRGGVSTTFSNVNVNTTAFEASGNKTGAGGGELRVLNADTSEWSAGGPVIPNINTLDVSAQVYGALSSIGSGPWLGGQEATGTIQGRAKRIKFTRVSGTQLPLDFEVDLDFRGGIQSMRIVCNFPNPCTSSALTLRASLSGGLR